MAQGVTTLDFGAFPGKSDTSVAITGQSAILSGSLVEAWLRPEATADHSADEHMLETIKVLAGSISPGVGFTIYGFNASQTNEPTVPQRQGRVTADMGAGQQDRQVDTSGSKGTRIYGTWTVAWVWNG